MKQRNNFELRCARRAAAHLASIIAIALLFVLFGFGHAAVVNAGANGQSDSKKDEPAPTTKITIHVSDPNGKPVGQASIYVRFNQTVGVFHKDKLAELDLKTNDDGSCKVPPIPQGKIMIQVIAKGWRTYGQWYDLQHAEETVPIKLQARPHWY